MSLLHLVHKTVAIKFTEPARNQFNPEVSYAFRLTGVDAMGFLQIQDLKPGGLEDSAQPYWINKDLVREIREVDLAKTKEPLHYTGKPEKPAKSKAPAKPKPALS